MLSSRKNSIAWREHSYMDSGPAQGGYHEYFTQPPRSSSAPTVLMILGGVFMLLAVIFSIALYIWGRSGPSYGENWNDLIAAGFIFYGGVLFFVIGLLLFVIGVVLRVRRKAA
jgi:hypothetical protein